MPGTDARGTKRKCSNEECARPFYGLNQASLSCPNCGTEFDSQEAERANGELQTRISARRSGRFFLVTASARTNPTDVEAD